MSNEKNLQGSRVPGDPAAFAGTSEHSQQVALFAAVAQYVDSVPGLGLYHAVPNGGSRGDGTKRGAMIAGANMKAEGVKTGVSDTFLPVARHGYHGFYLEMKAPGKIKREPDGSIRVNRSGDRMSGESGEQIAWGKAVSDEGYLYAVFDSWSEALKALMWYLGFEHSKAWLLP
jgi:hypothetical protein